MSVLNFICFMCCFFPYFIKSEENTFIISTNRPLHVISDKFLSISVDPAVLLTRINLSDTSLHLARHLSPAYIRIAGPSTEFVKYIDSDEKSADEKLQTSSENLIVTPSVWFGINEWFKMANLTPVFGINDADTLMGVWNPKSILALLEFSDKFNLTCLWQMGYDSVNKTDTKYIEDLRIFRHILDAFPDRKNSWKIVGSDISKYSNYRSIRKISEELKGIADFVAWEQSDDDREKRNDFSRLFLFGDNNPKIWTSTPRDRKVVTVESALQWAREVGEASKRGFDVIFRKPRIHEFFVDTPVYWFSVLYKTLVGTIVLDMRTTGSESETEAFAYCAKNQNNYIHRGAMVIMIVNQGENEHKSQLKLVGMTNSLEVQSYVLSSKSDVRSMYMNGEKLEANILKEDKIDFIPKLRRAKGINGIYFSVPPKSIGFFVLPGAKVSTCIDDVDEMTLLMEEIQEDQELPFSDEVRIELKSRGNYENQRNLKDLKKVLEEELEADEKFYFIGDTAKTKHKLNDILDTLKSNLDVQKNETKSEYSVDEETRKMILERTKLAETQKKVTETEKKILGFSKLLLSKPNISTNNSKIQFPENITVGRKNEQYKNVQPPEVLNSDTLLRDIISRRPKLSEPFAKNFDNHLLNHSDSNYKKLKLAQHNLHEHFKTHLKKPITDILRKHQLNKPTHENSQDINLELSSSEVKKILKDRVKSRILKTNIRFTNAELSELMKKATARLKHNHILKHRSKELALRDKLLSRLRRDINMNLLNQATKQQKREKKLFLNDESVESSEAVSEILPLHSGKRIIVSPNTKSFKKRKVMKLRRGEDDKSRMESDDELDFYFDENNSEEPVKFGFGSKTKTASKLQEKAKVDENEFERKHMRLDEYFRNAKEIQKKFDDIDFSDEADYDNLDNDNINERNRFKRGKTEAKEKDNTKKCSHCKKNDCTCNHHLSEQLKKFQATFDKLLNSNKSNRSVSSDKSNGNVMKRSERFRKSLVRNIDIPHYTPLCVLQKKWHPQDILLLKKNETPTTANQFLKFESDFPLYEHLLLKNDIKRNVKDNLISDESKEDPSEMNEIKKEFDLNSTKNDYGNYQLILPNKSKLELIKRNNTVDVVYAAEKHDSAVKQKNRTSSVSTTPQNLSTDMYHEENKTISEDVMSNGTINKIHHVFKISKDRLGPACHEALRRFSSFLGEIGNKLKSLFHTLVI